MQTEILKTKLERFIQGKASPAEIKQIDAWLSNGNYQKLHLSEKERRDLHNNILYDVQCYTAYPLFYPKKSEYLKKSFFTFKKALWIIALIVLTFFVVFYNW
jgi:hypothetical protein